MTRVRSLRRSQRGSAAAEMALVTPLLLLILFGSTELGKYFMDEHIVVKAVRDGARYAARQPIANYVSGASGCQSTPPTAIEDATKNIVRTGNAAGSGQRLGYWTDSSTVTVTVACFASSGGQSMDGIYSGLTYGGTAVGAPVVTVSAAVDYVPLFGLFGFSTAKTLSASQQAAVTGV